MVVGVVAMALVPNPNVLLLLFAKRWVWGLHILEVRRPEDISKTLPGQFYVLGVLDRFFCV